MRVICISGKAESGKDTAARLLKLEFEERYKDVIITHYGDLVKYICKTFMNWDGEKDERGRSLLQRVGTDIVRKQSPTYWVDFLVSVFKFFPDMWDTVIIPDCRFPNEISVLRDAGFEVIHVEIVRPKHKNILTSTQREHESENSLCDVTPDYVIHNDSDIHNLHMQVKNFIKEVDI